jgi:hypothetical protein
MNFVDAIGCPCYHMSEPISRSQGPQPLENPSRSSDIGHTAAISGFASSAKQVSKTSQEEKNVAFSKCPNGVSTPRAYEWEK